MAISHTGNNDGKMSWINKGLDYGSAPMPTKMTFFNLKNL